MHNITARQDQAKIMIDAGKVQLGDVDGMREVAHIHRSLRETKIRWSNNTYTLHAHGEKIVVSRVIKSFKEFERMIPNLV